MRAVSTVDVFQNESLIHSYRNERCFTLFFRQRTPVRTYRFDMAESDSCVCTYVHTFIFLTKHEISPDLSLRIMR